MSAVPGSVTITFVADLTAAQAAYQAFLAYVAANPPVINFGGGPGGGGGGGGNVYNYHTVNNTYNTTRNVVVNRAGGGRGGGRGGRGGGGGGGRRRGSSFSRYLRGYFLARETERLVKDFADYNVKAGSADSELARYKAEEGLQRSLFSIPLIGPIADVASLPYRAQTEQTAAQAAQQDQQTAAMERAMQFAIGLSRQGAVDAAGPAGSDPARLQEVENRRKAEEQKVIDDTKKQLAVVEERETAAKSAVTAAQQRYEIAEKALYLAGPAAAAAMGQSGRDAVLAAAGIRKPDVQGEDATAEADAAKAGAVIRAQDAVHRKEVEDHARHEREELQYQQDRALQEAQQRTRIAEAQYNLQPDVARADQTYFSGINAVEAARHRGRIPEALEDAQATRYRLLAEQRELLNSGRAVSVEGDPFSNAVGGPILDDQGGEHVSEEAKRDDLAEAIQELQGNLLPKIDQLIAELQGL